MPLMYLCHLCTGATMERQYTPAKTGQKGTVIHIYSSERKDAIYVTDPGVKHCGTLRLDLDEDLWQQTDSAVIQTRMTFSDTEIHVSALDVATGKTVKAAIDFLNK